MTTLLAKPDRVVSVVRVESSPVRGRVHSSSRPSQPSFGGYPAQPSAPLVGARVVAGPSVSAPHRAAEPQFSTAGMLAIMISLAILMVVATIFLGLNFYEFLTTPEFVEGVEGATELSGAPLGW